MLARPGRTGLIWDLESGRRSPQPEWPTNSACQPSETMQSKLCHFAICNWSSPSRPKTQQKKGVRARGAEGGGGGGSSPVWFRFPNPNPFNAPATKCLMSTDVAVIFCSGFRCPLRTWTSSQSRQFMAGLTQFHKASKGSISQSLSKWQYGLKITRLWLKIADAKGQPAPKKMQLRADWFTSQVQLAHKLATRLATLNYARRGKVLSSESQFESESETKSKSKSTAFKCCTFGWNGNDVVWYGIRHGLDWYAMTFYLCTAWPAVESIKLMRLVAIIDVPFQVRVWQLIF